MPPGAYRTAPKKLTPEVHALIVGALRRGNTPATAAYLVGIHPMTLAEWKAKGKVDTEGPYRRLYLAMMQAQATVVDEVVQRFVGEEHAQNWKANAFWLERRMRKEWGPEIKVESKVSVTTEIETRSPEDQLYYALHGYMPERAPKEST